MSGHNRVCSYIKSCISLITVVSAIVLIPKLSCIAASDEVSSSGYNMDEYKALISEFKDELREGNLKTEEDVRDAIREAEDKYGVDISAEEEQKAVDLMDTVNDLGVDEDKLADVVDDVYDKIADKTYETASDAIDDIRDQVIDSVEDAVVETVKKSFADYMKELWEQIKEFFKGLIASWNQ